MLSEYPLSLRYPLPHPSNPPLGDSQANRPHQSMQTRGSSMTGISSVPRFCSGGQRSPSVPANKHAGGVGVKVRQDRATPPLAGGLQSALKRKGATAHSPPGGHCYSSPWQNTLTPPESNRGRSTDNKMKHRSAGGNMIGKLSAKRSVAGNASARVTSCLSSLTLGVERDVCELGPET
ncbi:hypothetical protein SRHO_G00139630 [Serrasalmus rhombeus]